MQPLNMHQRRAHHRHRRHPFRHGQFQRPVRRGHVPGRRRKQRILQRQPGEIADAGLRGRQIDLATGTDIQRELLDLTPRDRDIAAEPAFQPSQRLHIGGNLPVLQDRANFGPQRRAFQRIAADRRRILGCLEQRPQPRA